MSQGAQTETSRNWVPWHHRNRRTPYRDQVQVGLSEILAETLWNEIYRLTISESILLCHYLQCCPTNVKNSVAVLAVRNLRHAASHSRDAHWPGAYGPHTTGHKFAKLQCVRFLSLSSPSFFPIFFHVSLYLSYISFSSLHFSFPLLLPQIRLRVPGSTVL